MPADPPGPADGGRLGGEAVQSWGRVGWGEWGREQVDQVQEEGRFVSSGTAEF